MDAILQLCQALWNHDIEMLANPALILTLYTILFLILFFENGLLPAAFLPGDSLLVLVGVLVAKGTLHFFGITVLLVIAASLGSWVGYVQGRWLRNTRIVQNWLAHIPEQYHIRSHALFHKHGLTALFIGRFIAFVRTILPTLAGIYGLSSRRFMIFNWVSSILWIYILVTIGYILGNSYVYQRHEDLIFRLLILIPLGLLLSGFVGSILVVIKRKRKQS